MQYKKFGNNCRKSRCVYIYTIFNISYSPEFQHVTKKLQIISKKNKKKCCDIKKTIYLCIVLINITVLQIKKAKKMKKLVFMFVAMAAISFAACDTKPAAEATPAEEPATEAVDSTAATDSTAAATDSTATAPEAAADSTAAPADSAK